MRIAFVSTIFNFPWGGAEKPWTHAAEAARAAGHEILAVVSPLVARHPRMQALAAAGAVFHERTAFSYRPSLGVRVRRAFDRTARWSALRASLERFKPDCLLLNQGGVFDFVLEDRLLAWARDRSVPVVLYCHCNSEAWAVTPEMRSKAREVFAWVRATVFASSHNWRLAERQIGAAIPTAIVVQYPIEARLLTEPPPWPPPAPLALAVVARMDAHHKGLDLLLPALQAAWGGETDWTLNVHGDGPDAGYVQELAARHELSRRTRFHGFTSDIQAVWAQNHALLMPSRHEGCSHSMLEAFVSGRPVIATDVGGVSDWLVDGVNGFVCAAPTIPLLTETLRRVRQERARLPDMGLAAARIYSERRDLAPEKTLLRVMTSGVTTTPRSDSPG